MWKNQLKIVYNDIRRTWYISTCFVSISSWMVALATTTPQLDFFDINATVPAKPTKATVFCRPLIDA